MDNETETFCLSIPNITDSGEYSSPSDDSDIEVVSTLDEIDHELVMTTNGLCLDSDENVEDADDIPVLNHSTTMNHSTADSENDDDDPSDGFAVKDQSSTVSTIDTNTTGPLSKKRNRRAWSIKEKLRAISHYERSQSKHSTAKAMGCMLLSSLFSAGSRGKQQQE